MKVSRLKHEVAETNTMLLERRLCDDFAVSGSSTLLAQKLKAI